ncbi:MAG: hypothetical protein ACK5JS_04500 [Mangrovibacterium sp.]
MKYFKRSNLLGVLFLVLNAFAASAQETKLTADLGGFVRFNYGASSWKDAQQSRGGDFGMDCFGITAKANYGKLYLNAEYRLYPVASGGDFLKFGYFGYQFNESSNLRLGLVPMAFGNPVVNSNSFFYSIDYFSGLEDDYDMGISYTKTWNNFQFDVAFMKNAEDLRMGNLGDANYSRFGFDVASFTNDDGSFTYRNKEVNQVNGRLIYTFKGENSSQDLGASILYGQLLNLDTQEMGNRYAWSVHYNGTFGRFNLKAEATGFDYAAKNPDGESSDIVAMASFGAAYLMASKATNYTIGLSYTLPVESKILDSFTFYNDFGVMDKANADFENSMMNVTGVIVSAGPIYTLIDWGMGKNQASIGPEWNTSFAQGDPNAKWSYRFNINMGFYF